ncbi:MAG: RNA polymerase sigma factor [Desulfatitalea sp.]|nr:RNA polymerase sigma factor [Desulfatitalea sp.]NNK02456.1 RNA polymerase sigma factor [Desulfatitalea sp.]
MVHPFIEERDERTSDVELIGRSLNGSKKALESLILRHQAWVYNIAFKMVMDHDDACDVTQDILIKTMTALATYDAAKGAFRTWLYRITANHIISMKKKKTECKINDIKAYVTFVESIPDDRLSSHPEETILEEEVKINCMLGMIMCLNRKARLVFILGGIFGLTDVVGSDILGISRNNFRKILSRSRKKIYSQINGLCGLVDPRNPCRCSNKISAFVAKGWADAKHPRYSNPGAPTIKDRVAEKYDTFMDLYYHPFFELYRQQPFYDSTDISSWLRNLLESDDFHEIFKLS